MKQYKELLKNKVLIYLASRYFTYGLQFVTSLMIAAKLGPYYLGVWGFLQLIISYFQQLNFGIGNSLNVLLVQHKNEREEGEKYTINSLALISYIVVIAVVVFLTICYYGTDAFSKYQINNYVVMLSLILVFCYINGVFLNLLRVRNKINYVTFCQSIIIILNFVAVIFFKGNVLVTFLLLGTLAGNLFSFLSVIPAKVLPTFKKAYLKFSYQKTILYKGLLLFIYNTCNIFIIISTRSLISAQYSIEEFGLFTFSYSFAHAMLMLLEALSFIIFPKLIDKMSKGNSDQTKEFVYRITGYYQVSAMLLIFIALLLFPVILTILPKYQDALKCMNITAMTILMTTFSYGYGTLLIARNREKVCATIAFFSLLINCLLCYFLISIVKVEFSYVILSCMVAYFIFTTLFNFYGCKENKVNIKELVANCYPFRIVLPYLVGIIICVLNFQFLIFVPLLMFILLNLGQIKIIISQVARIYKNGDLFNI